MAEPAGTLKWASLFQPQGWNPQTQPNTSYTQLVYEGLLQLAADGVTIMPALAEEWTLGTDEVTFKLRKGVVFHDGTPFDAEAVIANINALKQATNTWRNSVQAVAEVVKVDDHTVTFKLSQPSPELIYSLTQQGLNMISPKALANGPRLAIPSGTGPYVYNEAQSVSGSKFVFDFFDKYYAPEDVGPKRVEVSYIPDLSARYNALLSGQVDAADGDATQISMAEAAGFQNHTWSTMRYHLLMLDRDGALKDARVRKALCMALPIDQINIARYNGVLSIPDQRFDEGDPSHVAGLKRYPYDIEGAKALLAEAGQGDLSLEFPSAAFMRIISELTKESFVSAGVGINVVTMPAGEYLASFASGRFPFAVSTQFTEKGGMFNYYSVRFAQNGSGNVFKVAPPERLEQLYQQALRAPEGEQPALLQEMTQVIHDEALDCGFFDTLGVAHYNPKRFEKVVTTVWEPSVLRFKDVRLTKDSD